jgi:hypothetical protein
VKLGERPFEHPFWTPVLACDRLVNLYAVCFDLKQERIPARRLDRFGHVVGKPR